MLTPLATLAALTVLWLVTMVVAELLDQRIDRIVAALKGRSALALTIDMRPTVMRVSQRSRPQPAVRAQPRLRAAAGHDCTTPY